MAPRYSPISVVCRCLLRCFDSDREKQRGNANRATLTVARKLVAYLLAVDRGQTHFLVLDRDSCAAA